MNMLSHVTRQLPYSGPMLLIYLVGIALSLAYLKRIGTPAVLTLISCGLLFLVTLTIPFIQGFIISIRSSSGNISNMQWQMFIVSMVAVLLRATAFGLLLAAVFSGRSAAAAAN